MLLIISVVVTILLAIGMYVGARGLTGEVKLSKILFSGYAYTRSPLWILVFVISSVGFFIWLSYTMFLLFG